MKSAANKTARADGQTERSGEAVMGGETHEAPEVPEAPQEQTITFQALQPGDEGPGSTAPVDVPEDAGDTAPGGEAADAASAGGSGGEGASAPAEDLPRVEAGEPSDADAETTRPAEQGRDAENAGGGAAPEEASGETVGDLFRPAHAVSSGAAPGSLFQPAQGLPSGTTPRSLFQPAQEGSSSGSPGSLFRPAQDTAVEETGGSLFEPARHDRQDTRNATGTQNAPDTGDATGSQSLQGAGNAAGPLDFGILQDVHDTWDAWDTGQTVPDADDAPATSPAADTAVHEEAPHITAEPATEAEHGPDDDLAADSVSPAELASPAAAEVQEDAIAQEDTEAREDADVGEDAEARVGAEAEPDAVASVDAEARTEPEAPAGTASRHDPAWPDPVTRADPESGADQLRRVREVPLPKPVSRALSAALAGLRDSVGGVRLGLEVPGVDEARKAQTEILAQIQDYVIPRVHMSTAPALVAVVGSTGAGKSTLVNTLAAAKVSTTGVRRPTTGTPVLVCHPDDGEWFAKGEVLGGLVRVDRPTPGSGLESLVLSSSERLPPGVALLDTPDIDSVEESHHAMAQRMLDAADLWVFVTTATRYADAPAWNLLRLAKERGARIAIVLSRVPPKSRDVIDKHFARMLQEYGLGEVERFVVNETTITAGRLPEQEISELRMWLTELSVDDQRREQAVKATLDGVLNSFRSRVPALARHMEAQVALRAELRTDVDAAYMGALAEIDDAFGDGSLLRGEVLARWQDFAGSGDLMKTLHLRRPGRQAAKSAQQAPARLHALRAALRSALEAVIVSAGQRAAEEVVLRWRQRDGAGERLADTPGLGRPSEEFARRVGRTVGAWQEHVIGLIRSGGVTKRSVAKLVGFDEEALSMVFVMGLLGYGNSDVAAVSGTGTLPERLLRGVLGAEALRSIGTKARSDLRARVSVLFDEETFRYVQVLDEVGIPDEAAAKRLYQATYNLEVAR
ncbi:hypothetical protein Sme01_66800 [Sphaerisporangium melleum]|uniref:AAA+ ATPase domain-containing protein n=1 Tax=Sphaerisporangium melleum TaxID=321316 RepID=A0A917VRC3_9ACTN|nr:GTPase [Sphaerisporangium melleum]GGL06524.1 hypothetical protein GCM10007964_56030 [Sphaerisporangium melleum]GII74204.1 hypothetical protein Sme01_66800 [Sphaerisporangium melleum]